MKMENGIEKTDQIANLLKTLDKPATTREARIDIYLLLVKGISEASPCLLEDLSRSAVLVLKHLKADIKTANSGLAQSALHLLGFLLHSTEIVSSFSGTILKSILQDICSVLETSHDKAMCTRALWCLGKQNIPDDIIAKEISLLLPMINVCIVGKNFESSAVEFEAINVFQRLLKQCPVRMLTNDDDWFKMVYPFVISRNLKVAERALKFLEKNVYLFKEKSENFSKTLINDLYEGLTDRLRAMFGRQRELFVLRVWCCFITILDKNMHQGTPLTNSLFKVVELAFKTSSSEILIAAYKAWTTLIDNFATSQTAICSPKRLKLLLMPLINATSSSQRVLTVEQARFDCWLHLISILKEKINVVFDQVVTPFLMFLFAAPDSAYTAVDPNLTKTPVKKQGSENLKPQTPRTPAALQFDLAMQESPQVKNLHFDSNSLKKAGAEILYRMMRPESLDEKPLETKVLIDFERLSAESFRKNSVMFSVALQDLTLNCGEEIDSDLLFALWKQSFCYINNIIASDEKDSLSVSVGGLLLSLQTLVDSKTTQTKLKMKVITHCYEALKGTISEHKDLLKTDSNPQGSFPIHILQLVFLMLRPEEMTSLPKRLFQLFDSLITDTMSGVSGQLSACQTAMETISSFAQRFGDKDSLWRFWATTADHLIDYVNRTHDINQGSSLSHDFSAILKVLLFPVNNLLVFDMPVAVLKEMNNRWSSLFASLVRESSLMVAIENNQAVEDLCLKLDVMIKNEDVLIQDSGAIGKLIHFMAIITKSLDYSKLPPENQMKMTPKSMKRRLGNLLGNTKSLVNILLAILKTFSSVGSKNDKMVEAHLQSILEVLETFFSKIAGPEVIKESVNKFGEVLAAFLNDDMFKGASNVTSELSKPESNRKLFSNKQYQFVGKLLDEVYSCVFERYGSDVDQDLLVAFTPLLKAAFLCEKSLIRSRAVKFWNKSFGQSKTLSYSDELRAVLDQIKAIVPVVMLNPQGEDVGQLTIPETEEEAQLPETSSFPHSPNIRKTLTASLRSPHKIHGSFLQKALSADKAAQSPSPRKNTFPKSPKTEPRMRPVRRKLPISLEQEDSNEFVAIPPSPKKRRVLTEHQKEILRSKSDVPVLYNQLDQTTQEPIFTEDTQYTMDGTAFSAGQGDVKQVSVDQEMTQSKECKTQDVTDSITKPPVNMIEDVMPVDSLVRLSSEDEQRVSGNEDIEKEEKPECLTKVIEGDSVKVRRSPRSSLQKSKGRERHHEKNAKARKSMRISFQNILKTVVSSKDSLIEPPKDSFVEEGEHGIKTENAMLDENEIIPSSYTPVHGLPSERPLPFKFSPNSLFAGRKNHRSSKPKSLVAPEDIKVANTCDQVKYSEEDVKPEVGQNLQGVATDHAKEDTKLNTVSVSPDFVPSSQSQNDPVPALKGITLLTPRRSRRQSVKTDKALEFSATKCRPYKKSSLKHGPVADESESIVSNTEDISESSNKKDKASPESTENADVSSPNIMENTFQETNDDVPKKDTSPAKLTVPKEEVSEHENRSEVAMASDVCPERAVSQEGNIVGTVESLSDKAAKETDQESRKVGRSKPVAKTRRSLRMVNVEIEAPTVKSVSSDLRDLDLPSTKTGKRGRRRVTTTRIAEKECAAKEEMERRQAKVQTSEGDESCSIVSDDNVIEGLDKEASSVLLKPKEDVAENAVDPSSLEQTPNSESDTDSKKIAKHCKNELSSTSQKSSLETTNMLPVKSEPSSMENILQPSIKSRLEHSLSHENEVGGGDAKQAKSVEFEDTMKESIISINEDAASLKQDQQNTVETGEGHARPIADDETEKEPVKHLTDCKVKEEVISASTKAYSEADKEAKIIKAEVTQISESEDSNSILGPANLNPESLPERVGRRKPGKRSTARKSITRKSGRKSSNVVKSKVEEKDVPVKEFQILAEKASSGLDSSFEESLSLSAIKELGQNKNETKSTAQNNKVNCDSQVEEQDLNLKNSPKENKSEQILNGDEDIKLNGLGTSDVTTPSARPKRRKRKIDDISSETFENIFNSPDNPGKCEEAPTRAKESFQIIESNAEILGSSLEAGDSEIVIIEKKQDANVIVEEQKNRENESKAENCATSAEQSSGKTISLALKFSRGITSSPSTRKKEASSPTVSPMGGILKKRVNGTLESPSPNKNRRVSFAFPLEEMRSFGDVKSVEKTNDLAVPLPLTDENEVASPTVRERPRKFTAIRKKLTSPKIINHGNSLAIYPELVDCTTPIETILPSISSMTCSRGWNNLIRSRNIRTVGSLCALSEFQIEALPIRSPKVDVVKSALGRFKTQQNKGSKRMIAQEPLSNPGSSATSKTPPQEATKAIASAKVSTIVETPSKKRTVKPTSLFARNAEPGKDRKKENAFRVAKKVSKENGGGNTDCFVDHNQDAEPKANGTRGSDVEMPESKGQSVTVNEILIESENVQDTASSVETNSKVTGSSNTVNKDSIVLKSVTASTNSDSKHCYHASQECTESNATGVEEPKVCKPESRKPEVCKPEASALEVCKPEVSNPEASEPEVSKSDFSKPEISKPEVKKLEVSEQEVKKLEVSEPEVNKLEVSEPEVSKPEVTKLEVSKPELRKFGISKPESESLDSVSTNEGSLEAGNFFDKDILECGKCEADLDEMKNPITGAKDGGVATNENENSNRKLDNSIDSDLVCSDQSPLRDSSATSEPEKCIEKLDKAITAVKDNLSKISLKESIELHRKLLDFSKLMFDTIEIKFNENS